ncbi:TPA: hypothetical protein ACPQYX_002042 [Haemophilus influenzae]|uniref:hypothetical protein n=1 Tax=Haemophilus influenzae TaxID=727 RepID=UPI000766A0C2|nr:hypothetical protein [Haemophilus influenzae]MCK8943498.1 hypothetical protein [Haemophilus influenzae]MCK8949152.1 hypothetical protein [Haemophilus influenzae]MCK9114278.1 hypothetical protein [Haemophilus influenzae]NXZ83881.1 hypothetical protein [Haemophilus influenzae]PRI40388.1 hypothetical protein BVZ56_00051 [Haemophilus influenzae]
MSDNSPPNPIGKLHSAMPNGANFLSCAETFSFIVCIINYKLTVQEYGMPFLWLKL